MVGLVERGPLEPDENVRDAMLGAIHSAAFDEFWHKATHEPPPPNSWIAAQLAWALVDPAPRIRRHALLCYSSLRWSTGSLPEELQERAEQALEDADPEVREEAFHALLVGPYQRGERDISWRRQAVTRVLKRPITIEMGRLILGGLEPAVGSEVVLLLLVEHPNPELSQLAQSRIVGEMVSWKVIDRYPEEEQNLATIRGFMGQYRDELQRRGYAWLDSPPR